MTHFTFFLVILIALLYFNIQYIHALTVKVQPHQEACFYENVTKKNVKIILQYQVSSGGFLDIDTTITSPQGNVIHTEKRENEGKINFVAEHVGPYKFCFSNAMSTMTSKTVSFEVHIGDLLDPGLDVSSSNKDPIERSILRLNTGLGLIQNQQKHLRTREREHRDTAEKANSRVLWWSLLEILILVGISLSQVYYLKRFFEVRSRT